MRLLATLLEGRGMEWRIKVNPKGVFEDSPNRSVIEFWSPDNEPQNRMLLYNPKIALCGRPSSRFERQSAEELYIPVNRVYLFANKLMSVYKGLSNDKLKIRSDEGKLYMDNNAMVENAQKLNLFGKSVIIAPTIVRYANEELLGVQFSQGGNYCGMIDHLEARELCEVLGHTDLQIYAMMLAMIEKLDDMDHKLDRIIGGQAELMRMVSELCDKTKKTIQEEKKETNEQNGLDWKRLEV